MSDSYQSCACEKCEEIYRALRAKFEAEFVEDAGQEVVMPAPVARVMFNEWGKLFAKRLPEGATQPEAKA